MALVIASSPLRVKLFDGERTDICGSHLEKEMKV
jgi:hypothetical protein